MIPQDSSSAPRLLTQINLKRGTLSATQHRLARRKVLLQEQATRLRLGAPTDLVSVAARYSTVRTPPSGSRSSVARSQTASIAREGQRKRVSLREGKGSSMLSAVTSE